MEKIFDKNRIRLSNEQQIVDYVTGLLNKLSSKYKESSSQLHLLYEKLTNWLNGNKDIIELTESESIIFELFSADAFENFSKSVPFFKLLFSPKKVKFNPADIVFVNLFNKTYLEIFNEFSDQIESENNSFRIKFLKKSYLFRIKGNYLNISNENDTEDLYRKTLYLPFIERIWIYEYRLNFSTIFGNLKILYHGKEEIFLEIKEPFNTMSEEDINELIKYLIKHQPLLKIGH